MHHFHFYVSILTRKDARHAGEHAVLFFRKNNSWTSVQQVEAHAKEAQARDPLDYALSVRSEIATAWDTAMFLLLQCQRWHGCHSRLRRSL